MGSRKDEMGEEQEAAGEDGGRGRGERKGSSARAASFKLAEVDLLA